MEGALRACRCALLDDACRSDEQCCQVLARGRSAELGILAAWLMPAGCAGVRSSGE